MAPISPHTILLLVANPVDILTYFARKLSGLPESQVLGTGTSLDSARLRGALAQKAEVAPNSIDAYVLGEHGDSQFVSHIFCHKSVMREYDKVLTTCRLPGQAHRSAPHPLHLPCQVS